VLNVGQGSGNFVEYFADDTDVTAATATLLFDLGAEGASSSHDGPSVEYVVTRLQAMAAADSNGEASIDLLVLSHSDMDHISMIEQLLDQFSKPGTKNPPPNKPILNVSNAFYGGNSADYVKKKPKLNVLAKVKTYHPKKKAPVGFSNDITNLNKVKTNEFYSANGIKVAAIIVNVISTRSRRSKYKTNQLPVKGAIQLNSVSLVARLSFDARQYVITGDATGITMNAANMVMKSINTKKPYFDNTVMMTVPHHGSITTAKKTSWANVTEFAERIGAKSVTVSAAGSFNHPSGYLLSKFWPVTSGSQLYQDPNNLGYHFYVAYYTDNDGFELVKHDDTVIDWPENDWDGFYTCKTPVNLYTTQYYVPQFVDALGMPPRPKKKRRPAPPPDPDIDRMAVFPLNTNVPIDEGTLSDPPTGLNVPKAERGWTYTTTAGLSASTLVPLNITGPLLAMRQRIIAETEKLYGRTYSRRPTERVIRVRPGRRRGQTEPEPPNRPSPSAASSRR
jgi:hypothetical protein